MHVPPEPERVLYCVHCRLEALPLEPRPERAVPQREQLRKVGLVREEARVQLAEQRPQPGYGVPEQALRGVQVAPLLRAAGRGAELPKDHCEHRPGVQHATERRAWCACLFFFGREEQRARLCELTAPQAVDPQSVLERRKALVVLAEHGGVLRHEIVQRLLRRRGVLCEHEHVDAEELCLDSLAVAGRQLSNDLLQERRELLDGAVAESLLAHRAGDHGTGRLLHHERVPAGLVEAGDAAEDVFAATSALAHVLVVARRHTEEACFRLGGFRAHPRARLRHRRGP